MQLLWMEEQQEIMWREWSECSALNVAYNMQKSQFKKCVHVDVGKHGKNNYEKSIKMTMEGKYSS